MRPHDVLTGFKYAYRESVKMLAWELKLIVYVYTDKKVYALDKTILKEG